MKRRGSQMQAAVGYGADPSGAGVAYVRVAAGSGAHVLRVPFRLDRGAHGERVAGYAALTAVARALRERGAGKVRFLLDDPSLVADLQGHGDLPEALALAYVRLRCALNQLQGVQFEEVASGDLAARARAEVALHAA